MHFVISARGDRPIPPERCYHLSLLLQRSDGDTVTLMLFHDAVLMAVMEPDPSSCRSAHPTDTRKPSPSERDLWACRPCVDARGLALPSLDHRSSSAG